MDDETVSRLKLLLAQQDLDDLRHQRLNALFSGNDDWLQELDDRLETTLGDWLNDGQADELTRLTSDAVGGMGVEPIRLWFEDLLDGWAVQGAGAEPDVELPGAQLGEAHVEVPELPDGSTREGPRFIHIGPVEGFPGCWVALDTTEPNQEEGWMYLPSETQPGSAASGWLDQSTAFALMQGPTPEPVTPVEPADAPNVAAHEVELDEVAQAAEDDIAALLGEAFGEVPGVEPVRRGDSRCSARGPDRVGAGVCREPVRT